MKEIVKQISNGQDLEMNIPKYFGNMMDSYIKNSYVRFTMNYYTYFDGLNDKNPSSNAHLSELVDEFKNIVKDTLLDNIIPEKVFEAVKSVDGIRNQVIKNMKGVTSVVDILNMYEYCLNRVEYRFKENEKFKKMSDEDITREIMQYIVAEEDNMVISMKICDVLRQLPIRMTKAKFFELVHEGMKVYKGSEKRSIDDFMYMLRTSSTIDVSDDAFNVSDEISEILEKLKATDYKNIDEETYDRTYELHNYAAQYIEGLASDYMLFEELVNDLYIILLAKPYIEDSSEEKEICVKVISCVNNMIDKDQLLDMDDELADSLMALEGRQEKYTMLIGKYEYVYDMMEETYKDLVESLMLGHQYKALRLMEKLQSASIFIEFNENEDIVTEPEYADEEYIDNLFEDFVSDYKLFTDMNNKPFIRAAMANIISGLPVFFANISEIQDYIYNSLNNCSDIAEKTACKEILYGVIYDMA